jgi:hypothetical protein
MDKRQEMDSGCNRLELVPRDLYNQSAGVLILDWHVDAQATVFLIFAV